MLMVQPARLLWDGPAADVLWLLAVPPPAYWEAEGVAPGVSLFWALDTEEQRQRVVGVEVVDALHFTAWERLPQLPTLWELPGEPARPLVVVLQQAQQALRAGGQ